MDSGSNSGRLNAVASRRADGAKVVGIDQAIFTCIRTPMGQGYRVVAASRGLRAKESSEIVTHAPSGDGLCDEGPEPVGISFFPLQSGRFCILHSRYAGAEPTGRGGQRAYTRAFVLDAEQLARFGNSPFQVLRAAYAAGTLVADLKPPTTLPTVDLLPQPPQIAMRLAEAVHEPGTVWLCHLMDKLLAGDTLIVTADINLPRLADALLAAIPAPLRTTISFSAGVRFSVGRTYRLSVLSGSTEPIERLLRGQPACVLDLTQAEPLHTELTHAWAIAANRLLQTGRAVELAAFTAHRFSAADAHAVEAVGRAILVCEDARTCDTTGLIRTVVARLQGKANGPLDAELTEELVQLATGRLTEAIPQARRPVLDEAWQTLCTLRHTSPRIERFKDETIRSIVLRTSEAAPMEAIAMASQAVRAGLEIIRSSEWAALEATLSERAGKWLAAANAETLPWARQVLQGWLVHAINERNMAEILKCVDERVEQEETAPTPPES